MEMIDRNQCILNNTYDLKRIATISNFPIFCGCTDSPKEEDFFSDMVWSCSESSGVVQLSKLVPIDLLYRNHHNSGTVGGIWKEHHKKFSQFIKKNSFEKVLEIGGATGSLFEHFKSLDNHFTWNVLEPSNVFPIKDERINLIPEFLETHDFGNKKFDTIIHSHVLEHVYSPLSFLSKIHDLLEDGGYQYISFPNIPVWLNNGYSNALFFEHTYFLDEEIISEMLHRVGFSITSLNKDDHSIFIECKKSSKTSSKYKSNSYDIFMKYLNVLQKTISEINAFAESDKIYLFGAHIFSQILLRNGISESSVISILDNDSQKWGKRLYGTNLYVESPEVLKRDTAKVIVNGGVYTKEISENLKNMNPNLKIFPRSV